MDSANLRKTFLDYFAGHDHRVVPSAPLIPQNDPTLMFVNAGMVPFKDVFTGQQQLGFTRACSSQKCIRISGKHNDLENVGVTARHHTFFEMLGNFSFGDYFKEEAIVRAWDFLTNVLELPQERMVVTVFKGDEQFAADDEAAQLWRKVTGWGEERILRLGTKDNFWTMGDTGPCGPCAEVHFCHGNDPDPATFGQEPGVDGRGWTEIWNLVFMQYNRASKGAAAEALPAPSIDTGAGLERLACLLQGVTSNYDTDILRRLLARIEELAKKKYTASPSDDDVSMRVIADHARTTAFLIAEGVMPDKNRREYVLRRVMRRAIRHGHRLGIEQHFMHHVALEVVDAMGDTYPELKERRELIERVAEGEEQRFRATLRRGMKILDEKFSAAGSPEELSPEVVADLYTTYGFPVDLTAVIAAEHGLKTDVAGATRIIKSGDGASGDIDPKAALDGVYRGLASELPATQFVGYEVEEATTELLAIVRRDGEVLVRVNEAQAGDDVDLVFAKTPFYAESGGQVGDCGELRGEGVFAEIADAQRYVGDVSVHRAKLLEGTLRVGQDLGLKVDHPARTATRRNHSATHLLHWALKRVLGAHAQQKGSLVGPAVMRFDFAHNQPLSREEIEQIEELVNAKILGNAPVTTDVLTIADARAKGAVAIFEEKYGEVVRVLTMTEDSVELCGGTHCTALGDIGLFKIVSEGGTAAGVRRIMAATGHNALAHVRALEEELQRTRVAAKATTGGDLAEKVAKLVQREKEQDKRIAKLEKQLLEGGASGGMDAMLDKAKNIDGLQVLGVEVAAGSNMGSLRELAEKLRDKLSGDAVVLVAAKNGPKAQLVVMVSKPAAKRVSAGKLIKSLAVHVGGSGGGRPDMAQAGGAKPEGIPAAVEALYEEVASALAVSS